MQRLRVVSALVLLGSSLAPSQAPAQDVQTVDLAEIRDLRRVHGSVGDGSRGVPVAGGGDLDGDGFFDYCDVLDAGDLAGPGGRRRGVPRLRRRDGGGQPRHRSVSGGAS